jgi:membrane associated rhomboid family serine protease
MASNNGSRVPIYILKATPLIALFVVPPLDRSSLFTRQTMAHPIIIQLENLLLSWHKFVSNFISKRFVQDNLIFSERNFFVKGKWWCALSYMGVHANYEHLLNNALGLFMSSFYLYADVGISGVFEGLLSGGMVSVLNNTLRSVQLRQSFQKWVSLPFHIPAPSWLQAKFDNFSNQSLNNIVNFVRPRIGIVGCSGGIMALRGMSFALDIENVVRAMREESSFTTKSNALV